MKTVAVIAAFLFVLVGCSTPSSNVPDSLPAVGGALERVETRVSGAEALITQAGKGSAGIVKALLDASLVQLGFVKGDLDEAKTSLAKGESERALLIKNYDAEHAARVKDESSWWYWLAVWSARVWHTFLFLLIFHYVAIGLSLFLPPPWSVIARTAGSFVNPLGWGEKLVGKILLNRATAASSASVPSAMAGVASVIFPQAQTDH